MRPSPSLKILAALLLGAAPIACGFAQDYPNRPIRLINPLTAGGVTDIMVRAVADKMSARLKQPVVVENRVGGGTAIGMEFVAKSPPDGYTLSIFGNSLAVLRNVLKLNFDPAKELVTVATLATIPFVFVVHPEVPAKNLTEFINYVKANPGKVNFGVVSPGGGDQIGQELLQARTGIKMTTVQYKGASQALPDLLAGRIQARIDALGGVKQQHDAGTLRILAVTSATRMPTAPDIPTIAEQGVPGYDVAGWYILFAPTGTPREIQARWSRELAAVLKEPDIIDRMRTLGMQPSYADTGPTTERFRQEETTYGKIIRDLGITPQ